MIPIPWLELGKMAVFVVIFGLIGFFLMAPLLVLLGIDSGLAKDLALNVGLLLGAFIGWRI